MKEISVELQDASNIPDAWETFKVSYEVFKNEVEWEVYTITGEDGREIPLKELSIFDFRRLNQEITAEVADIREAI
jgi:hypothetical protein